MPHQRAARPEHNLTHFHNVLGALEIDGERVDLRWLPARPRTKLLEIFLGPVYVGLGHFDLVWFRQ